MDEEAITVRLDWADYQHWCPSGTVTPAEVTLAAIQIMLEHGATIPDDFDIARVRHVGPGADEAIAGRLTA